jgi:hypothetical protein
LACHVCPICGREKDCDMDVCWQCLAPQTWDEADEMVRPLIDPWGRDPTPYKPDKSKTWNQK